MVVSQMDAAAELERDRVSNHQIQPEYGDEQADAGRDGWARLARPSSQARPGTGEYPFSLLSWPRAGLATLPGWSILCYMWWPYIIASTQKTKNKKRPEDTSSLFLWLHQLTIASEPARTRLLWAILSLSFPSCSGIPLCRSPSPNFVCSGPFRHETFRS